MQLRFPEHALEYILTRCASNVIFYWSKNTGSNDTILGKESNDLITMYCLQGIIAFPNLLITSSLLEWLR